MSEWQPIKTAPTDGTDILIYNEMGFIVEAWYQKDHWAHPFGVESIEPTHWMPLPPPPNLPSKS